MEQDLADRYDGEELIDTKVGGLHGRTKIYGFSKHAFSVGYGQWPTDYAEKYYFLN